MKTLFGMTAAGMMVMMMVAALPGTALAGKKECDPLLDETKPGEPFLLTKGTCINGTRLNEYQSTWHWCNTNGTWGPARRGYPIYWQHVDCCNNGDVRFVNIGQPVQKGCKLYQEKEAQHCINDTWIKTKGVTSYKTTFVQNGTACTTKDGCDGTCQNGVCQKKNALAAAMAGNSGTCGCSVCNECEKCAGKKCVPIQHVSPDSPQCLTE